MSVISLYWCADQQQTSTCRRQKSGSPYSKFSVESNELTTSFKNVDVQFRGLRVKSTGGKSAKIPQIRFFRRY